MSNTVTVLDPNNEPFEVSIANGRDLVNNAGWSYAKAEEPTASTTIDTSRKAPTLEEQLNGMEMDELREYALLTHREVLDKRFRKERMVSEILRFAARDAERARVVEQAAAAEAEETTSPAPDAE